jgi:membrane-bound lytic murein transglycosylase MltF
MFSRWIAEIAREHGIDAFVLAAMAVRESGLDPFARGAAGEYGLIQLHPRGVGRRVQFVQSEAFRQRCRRQLGACQRVILQIGARYLSEAVSQCGSLEAGLGAYNRGVCGSTRYATLVLDERAALLELAKNDPPTFARADVD